MPEPKINDDLFASDDIFTDKPDSRTRSDRPRDRYRSREDRPLRREDRSRGYEDRPAHREDRHRSHDDRPRSHDDKPLPREEYYDDDRGSYYEHHPAHRNAEQEPAKQSSQWTTSTMIIIALVVILVIIIIWFMTRSHDREIEQRVMNPQVAQYPAQQQPTSQPSPEGITEEDITAITQKHTQPFTPPPPVDGLMCDGNGKRTSDFIGEPNHPQQQPSQPTHPVYQQQPSQPTHPAYQQQPSQPTHPAYQQQPSQPTQTVIPQQVLNTTSDQAILAQQFATMPQTSSTNTDIDRARIINNILGKNLSETPDEQ